jgi:hypothetical protein
MKREKSCFKHPLPRYWLRPYLFALSEMFNKRWSYWYATILNGKPLDEPIPKIDFLDSPHDEAKKNLTDCVRYMQSKGHSNALTSFVEWMLWGFGSPIQKEWPVKVTEDISRYWYKNFNMGLMMKYPSDYMAWASCEIANMARSGSNSGYFPTPGHIVKMMVEMTMDASCKTEKVNDPCGGTGIMLLYASNYSLRLSYQDISLDLCKMAIVNGWLYMPWLAWSADIDWTTSEDRQKALQGLKEWKSKLNCPLPLMLTYTPKTNTLQDWI